MLRYGVPYKGSKNKIAEWVYSHFPKATNFYDLFAGGCAVTHAALLSGKFKHFLANDITDTPRLFYDAIHGKFHCESRWISRGDFYRLKDSEPYVRYVWSFGNNGRNYLYSKEVEPWKKALHYARVFKDFSLLHAIGIDTKDASGIWIKAHSEECKEKYIKWYCKTVLKSDYDTEKLRLCLTKKIKENSESLRNYLLEGLKKANKRPCDVDRFLGTNGMAGHYFGKSQWEFPTREVYIKLQGFLYLPLQPLWEQYHRVCKENAAVVLFSQMPFTANLYMSNPKEFRYEWIIEKDCATGFMNAKKMPLKAHENILVFYKFLPVYNPQFSFRKPYSCVHRAEHRSTNYNKEDAADRVTDCEDGRRYPRSVLYFNFPRVLFGDRKEKFHPTQKPTALLEYLIKTYTNEGETVLDNTMGSGSTGVACVNTNRNFIGIEKDEHYFNVAKERIKQAECFENGARNGAGNGGKTA